MPKKQISIVTITLIMLLIPQVALASAPLPVQFVRIRKITKDISTTEKKSAAVKKLITIVIDEKADAFLRKLAAEKLGHFRAVEAMESLKAIADSIEWNEDTERVKLKRMATLAYLQITVAQEPSKERQNDMLIALLDVVPDWAIDELSNRGVKSALPKIIEIFRQRYRSEPKRRDAKIKLCTSKIDLLTNNFTRHEALYKALVMEDNEDRQQRLRFWAVEELGKLDSTESAQILIYYAKELEKKYYDSSGKRIDPEGDKLSVKADYMYNIIIKKLKCKGLSKDKIKAQGLNMDKAFRLEHGYDEDCGCN